MKIKELNNNELCRLVKKITTVCPEYTKAAVYNLWKNKIPKPETNKIQRQQYYDLLQEMAEIKATDLFLLRTNPEMLLEELTDRETEEIREIIRAELAEIFFNLYKKKTVWI
jgi:hypothetical protein